MVGLIKGLMLRFWITAITILQRRNIIKKGKNTCFYPKSPRELLHQIKS